MNEKCKYYEFVCEYGQEYHCCKHPEKQDPEDDMWAECEESCDFIGEVDE